MSSHFAPPVSCAKKRAWSLPLLACLAVGASSPVWAQVGQGNLDENLWLQLGAFRPKIDSTFQASSPGGAIGTSISGENDLGLEDNSTIGSVLLGARLGDRWRMEFEYFKLDRRTERSTSRVIDFGNVSYPVSASLASEFESAVYRLSAGYSFFRTPNAEFGAVAGLHYTEFGVALEGAGTIGGVGSAAAREERRENLLLPTVGLYHTWAFAPKWILGSRVDVFSLNRNERKGTLVNAQANLMYRFTPNVALGVGYRLNDYRIRANEPDWQGELRYKFRGPQVLLNVGF